MPALLKTPWRWLFPRLQRWLPVHHGQALLAAIDRAATVFHTLYENGNYDPSSNGEGWLLQRLAATSPMVILDVGANRGDYARLALAACSQARVLAFEPIPAVFQQLQANLGEDERADLFCLALADQNGPLTFDFDLTNTGNTTAVQEVQASVHGLKHIEKITASGRSLDDFCAEHGINAIDLLKIDVEGFEACVLRGGAEMIAKSRISCIQLEYGKANLFSRTFIHDYMRGYGDGFAIGKLYPAGVQWFSRYSADLDDLMGPNLVMISRKRPELIQLVSLPCDVQRG
jgi:FkbM family methyltransferase